MTPKQRTPNQRNALEVYVKLVSEALQEKGLTMQKLLESSIELEPTPELIKGLFRQVGKALYGRDSTRDLTTTEMAAVYENFNRFLGSPNICVHVPWPSVEESMLQDLANNSN